MAHPRNNIRTYTGAFVDPFHMRPEQVRIEDIAHALSMMVRANGHLKSFFSIAQHCLNCAAEAKSRGLGHRVQLACLLHDAAECYIADVPRPVKHRLEGYAAIEDRAASAVFEAFNLSDLTEEENEHIGGIDDAMLYYEFKALTGELIKETAPYVSMEHDFSNKPIEDVESDFLNTFNSLY